MTRSLKPGETYTHPIVGGTFRVRQSEGYYETFIDKGGPANWVRHEGFYEVEMPEIRLSDAEYFASDEHRNQYNDRMNHRRGI